MTWRQSSGRDVCNACRRVVDLGAPLYVGERTPATWCEACAATALHQTLSDSVTVPKHVPVATGLVGLRELVAKFAPKVARDWNEGRE